MSRRLLRHCACQWTPGRPFGLWLAGCLVAAVLCVAGCASSDDVEPVYPYSIVRPDLGDLYRQVRLQMFVVELQSREAASAVSLPHAGFRLDETGVAIAEKPGFAAGTTMRAEAFLDWLREVERARRGRCIVFREFLVEPEQPHTISRNRTVPYCANWIHDEEGVAAPVFRTLTPGIEMETTVYELEAEGLMVSLDFGMHATRAEEWTIVPREGEGDAKRPGQIIELPAERVRRVATNMPVANAHAVVLAHLVRQAWSPPSASAPATAEVSHLLFVLAAERVGVWPAADQPVRLLGWPDVQQISLVWSAPREPTAAEPATTLTQQEPIVKAQPGAEAVHALKGRDMRRMFALGCGLAAAVPYPAAVRWGEERHYVTGVQQAPGESDDRMLHQFQLRQCREGISLSTAYRGLADERELALDSRIADSAVIEVTPQRLRSLCQPAGGMRTDLFRFQKCLQRVGEAGFAVDPAREAWHVVLPWRLERNAKAEPSSTVPERPLTLFVETISRRVGSRWPDEED